MRELRHKPVTQLIIDFSDRQVNLFVAEKVKLKMFMAEGRRVHPRYTETVEVLAAKLRVDLWDALVIGVGQNSVSYYCRKGPCKFKCFLSNDLKSTCTCEYTRVFDIPCSHLAYGLINAGWMIQKFHRLNHIPLSAAIEGRENRYIPVFDYTDPMYYGTQFSLEEIVAQFEVLPVSLSGFKCETTELRQLLPSRETHLAGGTSRLTSSTFARKERKKRSKKSVGLEEDEPGTISSQYAITVGVPPPEATQIAKVVVVDDEGNPIAERKIRKAPTCSSCGSSGHNALRCKHDNLQAVLFRNHRSMRLFNSYRCMDDEEIVGVPLSDEVAEEDDYEYEDNEDNEESQLNIEDCWRKDDCVDPIKEYGDSFIEK